MAAKKSPIPFVPLTGHPNPLPWPAFGRHVILWHGTLKKHAGNIQNNGIDPRIGRANVDFGLGFYTTTFEWQARQWAEDAFRRSYKYGQPKDPPAVLMFKVDIDALAPLENLSFVRGSPDNDLFWSFIVHCRSSTPVLVQTHRPHFAAPRDWFDVVSGPVVAAWIHGARKIIRGFDQFSFHTDASAAVLNALIYSRDPQRFSMTLLPLPY